MRSTPAVKGDTPGSGASQKERGAPRDGASPSMMEIGSMDLSAASGDPTSAPDRG